MENGKRTGWQTFQAWFGIGALMFGTYCGANMASGVYASAYIVTLGGGWAFVWLAMFCAAMSFFCSVGLNFIRAYKVNNYNAYYLALYGLQKPDSNALLKNIVTIFFDIYTILMGLVTVAATIALFAELFYSLLGVPVFIGSVGAVLLFAVLTIYGAGFLRKFNTVMTISLILSILAILVSVIAIRGDVLAERIGNFEIGPDWGITALGAHLSMFVSYCFTTSSWGSSLSNYAEEGRHRIGHYHRHHGNLPLCGHRRHRASLYAGSLCRQRPHPHHLPEVPEPGADHCVLAGGHPVGGIHCPHLYL